MLIADNGIKYGSQAIAEKLGARVVNVQAKGYGSALMGGIAAARGRYVIMGDADDSYDFLEIPKFVHQLRPGVQKSCRAAGCHPAGGTVLPGAMPFLHRWWGNPMFSIMARQMFRAPINDIYCGMRGFTKRSLSDASIKRCTGMEFATEMIIKASRYGLKIGEVPITLHPDGRKAHAPHLKTFRDGWRTLRFFLMCSPRWLFLWPGFALFALGLVGYALAMPGIQIHGATLGRAYDILVASLALLVGQQAILFAMFAKMFTINERLLPSDPRVDRFFTIFTLEKGLMLGAGATLVGLVALLFAVNVWRQNQFGPLDYGETMRTVIPAVTLIAMGMQSILGSFMISILSMQRR